jgi:hypothetical protein
MAFISLSGITCWGNPFSQRVCPSPVFPHLVQRNFSAKSRFLGRPRLLTRMSPLPTGQTSSKSPLRIWGAKPTVSVGHQFDEQLCGAPAA